MTRYTKKVREEAALICAIAASTPDLAQSYRTVALNLALDRSASEDLAFAAWQVTKRAEHPDAEADALLMTGWTPS